jgi:hypothetical protein
MRLHSATGYVAPKAKLEARGKEIFADLDRKLESAREQRRLRREAAQAKDSTTSLSQCDKLIQHGEMETGTAGEQPVKGWLGQGSFSQWMGC